MTTATATKETNETVNADAAPAPLAVPPRPVMGQVVMAPTPSAPSEPPQLERSIFSSSDKVNELVLALAKAKLQFGDLERTREARVQSRREGGASYTYDYETLADVIRATDQALSGNGLVVLQFPFTVRGGLTLRTMLMHASGQWLSNDLSCSLPDLSPQVIGSGITYLERYARKAILGIAAAYDDDDGARASTHSTHSAQPIRPAERKSEQAQAASSPAPAPANGTGDTVLKTGKIASLTETAKKDGVIVRMDGGFIFGTRDSSAIAELQKLNGTNTVVSITASKPTDPKKAATLVSIDPVRA
jgi:hypothetical protein